MSRWTWHAVEAPRGHAYDLIRDDALVGHVTFYDRNIDPGPPLNALCDALAGKTSSGGAPSGEGVSQFTSAPPPDGPSTLQQQRDIHIEMAKLGGRYRERPFRFRVISTFLGREVTSTKQLTSDEADRVLVRTLEKLAERGAA